MLKRKIKDFDSHDTPSTRKIALILACFSAGLWAVSVWDSALVVPVPIFLWTTVVALFLANYSESGKREHGWVLSKYISFKHAVSAGIGFLMAIALMEILFGLRYRLSPLYLALGINLMILIIEWGIRRNIIGHMNNNKYLKRWLYGPGWLIGSWLVFSVVTLVVIMIIYVR